MPAISSTAPSHCAACRCSPRKIAASSTAVSGSTSVATVSAVGLNRAAPQLNASSASAAVTMPRYSSQASGVASCGSCNGQTRPDRPITAVAASVNAVVAVPAPHLREMPGLTRVKPAYSSAEPIDAATPHTQSSSVAPGRAPPSAPPPTISSTVPASDAARIASSARLARWRPRARAQAVTNTGGRHSAISVGMAAPMCAMPMNHSSTYDAITAPAPSSGAPSRSRRPQGMPRPNTSSSEAAPSTKRQNEMLCGW